MDAWRARGRRSAYPGGGNEIDSIAARWVAHLDRVGGSEADHSELREWLDADTRHRGAFVRAQAGWRMLDRDWQPSHQRAELLDDNQPAGLSRRMVIGGFSVTAVALAGLGLNVFPSKAEARIYTTNVGEIRRYRLDDGSTMTLDTQTRVEARMDGAERHVTLIAGGAFFEVVPGPRQPFLASSPEFRVACGNSSFSLATSPAPQVAVAAGQVELRRSRDFSRGPLRLERGMRAEVGRDGVTAISAVSPEEIARGLAWRHGGISLDGETVQEAAQLFNRYNSLKILVTDPALARQPIVGWFKVDQPNEFARAVTTAFGGHVRRGEDAIRIGS
jgi:transmembrane sensor